VEKIPFYGIELSLTDEFETKGISGWKQIKVNKENMSFKRSSINIVVKELVPRPIYEIA
jgi:hypothetical protein